MNPFKIGDVVITTNKFWLDNDYYGKWPKEFEGIVTIVYQVSKFEISYRNLSFPHEIWDQRTPYKGFIKIPGKIGKLLLA